MCGIRSKTAKSEKLNLLVSSCFGNGSQSTTTGNQVKLLWSEKLTHHLKNFN